MKKLNQVAFHGNNWQLITDNQSLNSVLKAMGVKDDPYSFTYRPTRFRDLPIAVIHSRYLVVWARWAPVPRTRRGVAGL